MLCPATMKPESPHLSIPSKPSSGPLVGSAGTPPRWQHSWVRHVPLVGKTFEAAMNAGRYETTLEQNAEFLARDLEEAESLWVGTAVGVISAERK